MHRFSTVGFIMGCIALISCVEGVHDSRRVRVMLPGTVIYGDLPKEWLKLTLPKDLKGVEIRTATNLVWISLLS